MAPGMLPGGTRRLAGGVHVWQWASKRTGRLKVGPARLDRLLRHGSRATRHPLAHHDALSAKLHEELLAVVLDELGVNVVLDVGANRGQFARLLRRIGYGGRIVSYEPVSANLARLRSAAASDRDWIVEGFALGDVESTSEINVSAGPGKLSSLLPSSTYGRARFAHLRDEVMAVETVQVHRLDTVFDRAVGEIDRPRVFLKLDTQGYDLLVVAGAGERLGSVVVLQSEVSCIPIYEGMPHLTEQLAAYERAGFAVAGMYPVSRDHGRPAVIEFDLVAVRRATR